MNFAQDKSVSYYTLGCKLNFAETSTIARQMEEKGFMKVPFGEYAGITVINTCSVTDNADKKCRSIIRKAKNVNPNAMIIVIGCYAQLKPDEISSMPDVDLVLGAKEKFNISGFLTDREKQETSIYYSSEISEVEDFISSYSMGDRTRSFLKVQDGCDYTCSFCTIPLARGKSRSAKIHEVVDNVRKLGAAGIKEIVLTGVNTGDFGYIDPERGRIRFLDLLIELDQVESITRFRISSVEPNLLSNPIIDFVAGSSRFMPHFHIPLQSGSDRILKLMRRRYLSQLYRERVEYIREKIPEACIGVDVITGFPSESKAEFLETYRFLNELKVDYLHVFPYSERRDTDASGLAGTIPVETRSQRSKMLRILSEKKKHSFYRKHQNQFRKVLFESKAVNGEDIFGFTDNYIKVKTGYNLELVNRVQMVELADMDSDGVIKALIPETVFQ